MRCRHNLVQCSKLCRYRIKNYHWLQNRWNLLILEDFFTAALFLGMGGIPPTYDTYHFYYGSRATLERDHRSKDWTGCTMLRKCNNLERSDASFLNRMNFTSRRGWGGSVVSLYEIVHYYQRNLS